ncbi:Hypothetical protein D9617_2g056850 [Elsinoe fawcettii]|nr:Hypothetical protein D9617_2g056850 [Elsinoe fawcettii]
MTIVVEDVQRTCSSSAWPTFHSPLALPNSAKHTITRLSMLKTDLMVHIDRYPELDATYEEPNYPSRIKALLPQIFYILRRAAELENDPADFYKYSLAWGAAVDDRVNFIRMQFPAFKTWLARARRVMEKKREDEGKPLVGTAMEMPREDTRMLFADITDCIDRVDHAIHGRIRPTPDPWAQRLRAAAMMEARERGTFQGARRSESGVNG